MLKPTLSKTSSEEITVPLPRVTGLVRQLTHDVRNSLNNIDLQSAYLQEIVADPQVAVEIKRLRSVVGDAAKMLREISARFALPTPNFVSYSANIFLEDFRQRLEKLFPEEAPRIRWTVNLREEMVSLDIEMLSRGLLEFFKNAFHFREGDEPIEAHALIRNKRLVLELVERKSSVPSAPDTWGREPLLSTRRGGFGMGLYYARQVLELHGGDVMPAFDADAKQLCTRLSLPLAAS